MRTNLGKGQVSLEGPGEGELRLKHLIHCLRQRASCQGL